MASGTKGNIFAALTDVENAEKIYLDNGVYKKKYCFWKQLGFKNCS